MARDPIKVPNVPREEIRVPSEHILPEQVEPAITFEGVIDNICDPKHWIEADPLRQLIIDNPSLRGIIYGYVAEAAFVQFLDDLGIKKHFKPDDHKKTKSDRTFYHNGRRYTIQLKSMQTGSIKQIAPGQFRATVQNDASDRRRLILGKGLHIETTCYKVGEYDILGVSLQPFAGTWRFALKKNKDLRRSTYKKYPPKVQRVLLSTLEQISFPLTPDWTEDLFALLRDPDLGTAI